MKKHAGEIRAGSNVGTSLVRDNSGDKVRSDVS